MMDMSEHLSAVNADIARRLSGCEEHLRAVATEYKAWTQSSVFSVLDQATRTQVEVAVRAYVTSNRERLQVAIAGLDALNSVGSVPQATPPPSLSDPLAEMVAAPPPPPAEPTARLGTLVESPSRRPPEPPISEQGDSDEDFVSVVESEPEFAASAPVPGSGEGRPKPRRPRRGGVPVKNPDGFSRSSSRAAPDGEGRPRTASGSRKHRGGATIRGVSEQEMLTDELSSSATVGDAGDSEVISSCRSLSPNADFDRTMQQVKANQRKALAAQKADAAAEADSIVMQEAEVVDDSSNMVGRASDIRRHGKQLIIGRVEMFLENMQHDWGESGGDAAAVLHMIVKARSMFRFQGAKKHFKAMFAYANRFGLDDSDPGILVLEDVGLASGVRE